jgi:stage II sporulation protein E
LLSSFKIRNKTPRGTDISEIFSKRLKVTANTISEIKLAIEKTAEILDKKQNRNLEWVYNSACGTVCRTCKKNTICWGKNYDDTAKEMLRLVKQLKKGAVLREADLPELAPGLFSVCTDRIGKITEELNVRYTEFVGAAAHARRICEMREVLNSSLMTTEKMLRDMSDEFERTEHFDRFLASKVEKILESGGISSPKAAVIITPSGRIYIEAYGNGVLGHTPEKLCSLIGGVLKREFDIPEVSDFGRDFKMTMYERAVFSIELGAVQYGKGNEKSCGDYYDSFVDGQGFAYVILSDGMGSGSRAKIDSAFACSMTSKLLRANVKLETAINIINNSLLVKSSDESFATLDICRINLYTGETELYKAGGSASYIKCGRHIIRANGAGLPIGVSNTPVYEKQTFTIGKSDLIIMSSDGAALSEKWIETELQTRELAKASVENVAETIAATARFSAKDEERDDDISVIAVKLVK